MWKRLISRGITSLCTKGVFTLGNLYCTLACLTPKVQLVGPCDCCVLCLGLTTCNVPYIQRLALSTVQLDYGTYWFSVFSKNTQAFKMIKIIIKAKKKKKKKKRVEQFVKAKVNVLEVWSLGRPVFVFLSSYGFIAWVVCLGPLQCWKMKQLSMRCFP